MAEALIFLDFIQSIDNDKGFANVYKKPELVYVIH